MSLKCSAIARYLHASPLPASLPLPVFSLLRYPRLVWRPQTSLSAGASHVVYDLIRNDKHGLIHHCHVYLGIIIVLGSPFNRARIYCGPRVRVVPIIAFISGKVHRNIQYARCAQIPLLDRYHAVGVIGIPAARIDKIPVDLGEPERPRVAPSH